MTSSADWHRQRSLQVSTERPAFPGEVPQSIPELLERWVAERPDEEALVGRHGRLTYRELDHAIERAAAALHALGLRPRDRIAVCLPNDVDIVVAFLASQRLGLVWVGINRPLAPAEKRTLLADAGAKLYLVAADLADELPFPDAETLELETRLVVDPADADDDWRRALRDAAPASAPPVEIDPFEAAAIAYTSGTTGLPKGAVHSQHNLLTPGVLNHLTGDKPAPAREGVVLPMTILNLMVLGPLTVFCDGRCLVAMDRIDALGVAEWVREERIGGFTGVPTIIHDLLTHPEVTNEDLATLEAPGMGGADCPPELLELYRKRFGREVRIGYGMTEAPTAVTWTVPGVPPAPGLCGQPAAQIEIEIVGEDGAVLGPDEVGEICVRAAREGPFAGVYTPMLGYWGRPEATAEALRDGRYHTGDLGTLDAEGNLYVRGRRNELILRGGANVYPAEVERVLGAQAGVAAVAVLGIPDARLGERVVAVVQPEPGASVDADALLADARRQLARYKLPERIRFVDEMPRNAMNKIVKPRLRPLFEDEAAGER